MGARRHRRDVHLGSGAVDRQEERQGADDLGRHLQAGRVHVRRPRRHHASSRRRIRRSWWRWSRRSPKPTPTIAPNPKAWTGDFGQGRRRSRSGRAASPRTCPTSMALYGFPSLQEQASPAWLGGGANGAAAKALTQQANFLKEQGRLTVGRAGLLQVGDDRMGNQGDEVNQVQASESGIRTLRRRERYRGSARNCSSRLEDRRLDRAPRCRLPASGARYLNA